MKKNKIDDAFDQLKKPNPGSQFSFSQLTLLIIATTLLILALLMFLAADGIKSLLMIQFIAPILLLPILLFFISRLISKKK